MEDFTAQENVMIPMRRLGRLTEEQMRARATDLSAAVGLARKVSRPSRHLSGGEQQRVAIARALANDPRVILADEPTGNLDTRNSNRAFELLQDVVVRGGKALLLVTHNRGIASALRLDSRNARRPNCLNPSARAGCHRLVNGTAATATEPLPSLLRATPDHTGKELKRGMFFNTIALLASNFRGVFTFLIARLLGAASLGTFLVAWATTDILTKIGMFGLDNAIVPFIARAEMVGDRARSRALFHLAVFLALAQSALTALLAIAVLQFLVRPLGIDPRLANVLSVLLCALPGVNLYRICTAVSRANKVMKHDIWSRGLTESSVTTLAFLGAIALGWKTDGACHCRHHWHWCIGIGCAWPRFILFSVRRPRRAGSFPTGRKRGVSWPIQPELAATI
jgi:hypothetical protein